MTTNTNPELIRCTTKGCKSGQFFMVPARQFPTLCLDHSDEASRAANGWTPENSIN